MKVQLKEHDWTKINGKEALWYAENAVGRIYFTSPMSTLQPGYALRHTTNPKEMDRLFNRMHEQEREQNERMVEKIYNRGREYYDNLRSELRNRLMATGVTDAEKNIIRASLKLMDERDFKMQQNTVYGVSSMQESEAPIPGKSTRVM
jgi:hypothetical protein